uniref:Uncharacterized protein n=1 Tax=Glossina brevipalpis TaxID=37001 RepID=A0A1A9WNN7_9MUSC
MQTNLYPFSYAYASNRDNQLTHHHTDLNPSNLRGCLGKYKTIFYWRLMALLVSVASAHANMCFAIHLRCHWLYSTVSSICSQTCFKANSTKAFVVPDGNASSFS